MENMETKESAQAHEVKEITQTSTDDAKKEKAKNVAIKTLAVIGLAGVLAFISLGIVKYAPTGVKSLASVGVSLTSKLLPSEDNFKLTSDSYTANSGDTFSLMWTVKNKEGESYMLRYPCSDRFHIEAQEAEEGKNIRIPCDSDFYFASAENKITLAAFSLEKRSLLVPITLSIVNDESEKAIVSSDALITVENKLISLEGTPAATPSPLPSLTHSGTPTPTPRPLRTPRLLPRENTSIVGPLRYVSPQTTPLVFPTENPYGKPDLTITVLETGVINSKEEFTKKSEIGKKEKAAVRFEVKNIGAKRSGAWSFESKLPTKAVYTFRSGSQVSLMPQDKIEFVMGFDEFKTTSSTLRLTIKVDPTKRVDEFNENNNEVEVAIRLAK